MARVTIRSLSGEELAPVARLEAEVFSYPRTPEQMIAEAEDGLHETLAAFDGEGALCGYVSLMHVLDEGTLTFIAVTEEARRKGIGNALLSALEERASSLALSFISLEVRESNLPAISMYEKNGFVRTGSMKNYYSGPKENALILTKTF